MRARRIPGAVGVIAMLAIGLCGCSGGAGSSAASGVPGSVSGGSSAAPGGSIVGPVNTVMINAGGPQTGSFGADRYFSHGARQGNGQTIDMSQIPDDPPPAGIFNSERWGAMTYTIPDRTGPQTVTLYFSEDYVTGEGQRVFDVAINGTTVLSQFDIYASAGGADRAIARTFTTTPDSSGQVVIEFSVRVQQPKISGITVSGGGTTPTLAPPTAAPTLGPPPTNSADAKGSAGCGKAPTLRNGTIDIDSNGPRQYILRAPDNYDGNHAYRLILAYHWYGGTAQEVAGGTAATESPFFGLWDLAAGSTIFVAPQGLGSGPDDGWANTDGDDVAFTDAIIAQLEAAFCIDTTRVFATGFSYGASMSYALACARPDVFRGVVLFSGAEMSGCDGGAKPVAFYASHGVSDSTIDISMGRELRDHFVQVNGVTPQDPPEPAAGSGQHICTTYAGGSPRYPVEWCAFDGDHDPNPHDDAQAASWNPPQAWAFIGQF